MCLLCSDKVALVKSSSVKRHYETKHKNRYDAQYPPGSIARADKIKQLRSAYDSQASQVSQPTIFIPVKVRLEPTIFCQAYLHCA